MSYQLSLLNAVINIHFVWVTLFSTMHKNCVIRSAYFFNATTQILRSCLEVWGDHYIDFSDSIKLGSTNVKEPPVEVCVNHF